MEDICPECDGPKKATYPRCYRCHINKNGWSLSQEIERLQEIKKKQSCIECGGMKGAMGYLRCYRCNLKFEERLYALPTMEPEKPKVRLPSKSGLHVVGDDLIARLKNYKSKK